MKWEDSRRYKPSNEEEKKEEGNKSLADVRICEVGVKLTPFKIGSRT
jgi:hypothetical protein